MNRLSFGRNGQLMPRGGAAAMPGMQTKPIPGKPMVGGSAAIDPLMSGGIQASAPPTTGPIEQKPKPTFNGADATSYFDSVSLPPMIGGGGMIGQTPMPDPAMASLFGGWQPGTASAGQTPQGVLNQMMGQQATPPMPGGMSAGAEPMRPYASWGARQRPQAKPGQMPMQPFPSPTIVPGTR